ncbi:MAG: hypothetical protein ACPGO5_05180 [Patescibacteria group bacterium]
MTKESLSNTDNQKGISVDLSLVGLWGGAAIGALIGGIIMMLTTPEGPGAPPNFPYYIPGALILGLIGWLIGVFLEYQKEKAAKSRETN